VSESSGDRTYVEQLGTVLRTRDPEQLRAFLLENARRYGDDAQVEQITGQSADELEGLLHRMILSRSDLAELHAGSRQWLAQHGVRVPKATPDRRN
jgi:hypothetical protein